MSPLAALPPDPVAPMGAYAPFRFAKDHARDLLVPAA
jgi:hypothetical protein